MAKEKATKNSSNGFLKSFLFSSLINPCMYKSFEQIVIPKTKGKKFIRKNYAGREVNLYGGIVTGTTLVASGLPIFGMLDSRTSKGMMLSTSVSTLSGLVDDLDNGRSEGNVKIKGFKGHLSALKEGKVTTGILKIVGISSASLIASGVLTRKQESGLKYIYDYFLNAGLIATSANLHNLFDLRPGRCLKFSTLLNLPLLFSNPKSRNIALNNLFVIAPAFSSDLAEKTMLGDTGANALGSNVGVGFVSLQNRGLKTGIALGILGLTLLSEKVSFSKIIESNKFLKKLDDLGRIHE